MLKDIVKRLERKTRNVLPVYVYRDVIVKSQLTCKVPVCVAYVYKVPMQGRSLYYCVEVENQNPVSVRRICLY